MEWFKWNEKVIQPLFDLTAGNKPSMLYISGSGNAIQHTLWLNEHLGRQNESHKTHQYEQMNSKTH